MPPTTRKRKRKVGDGNEGSSSGSKPRKKKETTRTVQKARVFFRDAFIAQNPGKEDDFDNAWKNWMDRKGDQPADGFPGVPGYASRQPASTNKRRKTTTTSTATKRRKANTPCTAATTVSVILCVCEQCTASRNAKKPATDKKGSKTPSAGMIKEPKKMPPKEPKKTQTKPRRGKDGKEPKNTKTKETKKPVAKNKNNKDEAPTNPPKYDPIKCYRPGRNANPTAKYARQKLFTWDDRIEQLTAWKNEHGHLKIPTNLGRPDRSLGLWLAAQRSLYSRDNIRQDRLDELRRLGANGFDGPNEVIPGEAG
ncbi:expressed unknown protein [Seminavis robusta]|uniref:Helicase-associated domain-containing protein n=1 Tax=Seminavis robusta TaxID=568900 RepID=A0A9N8ED03_9STRA|nr:expressed unknown protein [Seminavis robusta]|eukprot:Sro816_g206640.1 n/a (309) ;mRNA; r:11578-12504